jgi:pimeloyl-ACP methyl ester carboxylesterase
MNIAELTRPVTIGNFTFPVVDHGQGPPVLLLHGFPDSRHLWRYQIPVLAEAGVRVIAPDLRGFGDAPKPEGVEHYRTAIIAQEIIGLLDVLQIDQVRLVGHDWGAALAWVLAAYYPQRVERLVALSVGCPGTSGLHTLEQRERSWYFYFFQFEGVAEETLMHNDWQLFREWTRGQGDLPRYLQDLARPGALTAGLNWYRANVKPVSPTKPQREFPRIQCPVLGVWGDGDAYLTEGHLRNSHEKIDGPWRYEQLQGASHWLMLDQPEEVNRLLVAFLR